MKENLEKLNKLFKKIKIKIKMDYPENVFKVIFNSNSISSSNINYNNSKNKELVKKEAFSVKIIINKVIINMLTNKVRLFYKRLKFYLKHNFNQLSDIDKYTSFKIIFSDGILKFKNRLLLAYSLLKCGNVKRTILDRGMKFKLIIKKGIKYIWTLDYKYIIHKDNAKEDICLFFSDYVNPGIKTITDNDNEDNTFNETIKQLLQQQQTIKSSLRLPEMQIQNLNYDLLASLVDYFNLNKLTNSSVISFNLTFHSNSLLKCSLNDDCNQVVNNIINVLNLLITKLPKIFLIINLTLSNIDECFPLFDLFNFICRDLNQNIGQKYIINFRSFFVLNHPIIENDNYNLFAKGKSIYINKFFGQIEDFNLIYSLFLIIKSKFKKLNNKYIKTIIGNFLIEYKFIHIDKFSNESNQLMNSLINKKMDSCVHNIDSFSNNKLKKLFVNCDSNDETKMILFSENYNPLEI